MADAKDGNGPEEGVPNKRMVLVVVSASVFMATLDGSIVNLALPTIASEFSVDATRVESVVTSYLIAIASTLLLVGALGDRLGRKRLYTAGIAVFTVGSGLCAISTALESLVSFRVVQALGGSLMFAIGPAILTAAYPARERGAALGAIGTAVAAGQTAGPVIGGMLLQLFGWQAIFLVNIPIGVAALLLSRRQLADDHPGARATGEARDRPAFDVPGAVLLPSALFILMVAVEFAGHELAISPTVILLLVVVAGLLIAFRYVEKRAASPLVSFKALRNREFALSNTAGFLSFVAIGASFFVLPFYMAGVLAYEPYKMGLMLLPIPAAIVLIAPYSGRLSDRIGTRIPCVTGMALASLAALALMTLDAASTEIDLVWRLALYGGAMALFQSPNNSTIMGSVERHFLGLASGMMATMRTLGFALGVASGAGLLAVGYLAATGGMPLPPGDVTPDAAAFVSAQSFAFLAVAVMCAAAAVTSAVRPSTPPHGPKPDAVPATSGPGP